MKWNWSQYYKGASIVNKWVTNWFYGDSKIFRCFGEDHPDWSWSLYYSKESPVHLNYDTINFPLCVIEILSVSKRYLVAVYYLINFPQ